MSVDVRTEIRIDRPLAEVYRYTADPSNAPAWYDNIHAVEWIDEPAIAVGRRVRFKATFLGRTLDYTYELVVVEDDKVVMRTAEGPFPMETTYEFASDGTATTVRLRNRGEPSGFSKVLAPLMAPAMRRANRNDLRSLKAVLER